MSKKAPPSASFSSSASASAASGVGRGASITVTSIVSILRQAIPKGDGKSFVDNLYSPDIADSIELDLKSVERESSKIDAQYQDIFKQRMWAILASSEQRFSDAYDLEIKTLWMLIDLYAQKKDSYTQLLVKDAIFKSLKMNHLYATQADETDTTGDQYALRKIYFNALFNIYRSKKIDQQVPKPIYNLALKNICAKYPFSAISIAPWYRESDELVSQIRQFPVNDVCNFAFNCGRAKMLEDNYEKAVKWLTIALESSNIKNRFRIFALLIPMQVAIFFAKSSLFLY